MSAAHSRPPLAVLLLLLVGLAMPGCAAVAGIFKAGFWVGSVIAVIVIGGLFVPVTRMRG